MTSLKTIFLLSFCSIFFSCQKKAANTYISLEQEGCFGSKKSELFFYNQVDATLVALVEDGKEIKHAFIGEGQIAALSYFRQKIESMGSGGFSTSVQHFTFKSGNTNIDKVYHGYSDDFDRLTAVIFSTKE